MSGLIADAMLPLRDRHGEIVACGTVRIAMLPAEPLPAGEPSPLHHLADRSRDSELRLLRTRLVSVGRQNARARIAHPFAELHARLDRAGLVTRDAFVCPLTQEQIGDVLGLTSVHVNRVLRQLRREGLLSVAKPHAAIHDLDGLRDVGELEPNLYDPEGITIMSHFDHDLCRARANQERLQAQRATNDCARVAHLELARLYDVRLEERRPPCFFIQAE